MNTAEKRELAKKILSDNMSDDTSDHINKIGHLEQWIIDAMIQFNDKCAANVKNDTDITQMLPSLVECREARTKFEKIKSQNVSNSTPSSIGTHFLTGVNWALNYITKKNKK